MGSLLTEKIVDKSEDNFLVLYLNGKIYFPALIEKLKQQGVLLILHRSFKMLIQAKSGA